MSRGAREGTQNCAVGHIGEGRRVTTAARVDEQSLRSPSASPSRVDGSDGSLKGAVTHSPGGVGGMGRVGAVVVPEETFLESLHLDRAQMSDFYNSEGFFLYLRQKLGTDATAYNLEVRHRRELPFLCTTEALIFVAVNLRRWSVSAACTGCTCNTRRCKNHQTRRQWEWEGKYCAVHDRYSATIHRPHSDANMRAKYAPLLPPPSRCLEGY